MIEESVLNRFSSLSLNVSEQNSFKIPKIRSTQQLFWIMSEAKNLLFMYNDVYKFFCDQHFGSK